MLYLLSWTLHSLKYLSAVIHMRLLGKKCQTLSLAIESVSHWKETTHFTMKSYDMYYMVGATRNAWTQDVEK